MRCYTEHHPITPCNAIHSTNLHHHAMLYTAPPYTTMQRYTLCYLTPPCNVIHSTILYHHAMLYTELPYTTMQCYTLHYPTSPCNAIHSTTLHHHAMLLCKTSSQDLYAQHSRTKHPTYSYVVNSVRCKSLSMLPPESDI